MSYFSKAIKVAFEGSITVNTELGTNEPVGQYGVIVGLCITDEEGDDMHEHYKEALRIIGVQALRRKIERMAAQDQALQAVLDKNPNYKIVIQSVQLLDKASVSWSL